MIIEIKENLRAGNVLNSKQLERLSDVLNILKEETGIQVEIFENIYEAISYKEATAALDACIQGYDVFTTEEEYRSMVSELTDDILNQEQGFEELTCIANDMAEDVIKKYKNIY